MKKYALIAALLCVASFAQTPPAAKPAPVIIPVSAKSAKQLAKHRLELQRSLDKLKSSIKEAYVRDGVDGSKYDLNIDQMYFVAKAAEASPAEKQELQKLEPTPATKK